MIKGNNTGAVCWFAPRPGRRGLLVAAVLALLGVAAGGSYAALQSLAQPVSNQITLAAVTGVVQESFDGAAKRDVTIANTGTTACYVRVRLLPQFRAAGNVLAQTPQLNTDYTLAMGDTVARHWVQGADGAWYYTRPVEPGAATEVLVQSCTVLQTDPARQFALEIAASQIQALPAAAVEQSFSNVAVTVTVEGDGSLRIAAAQGGTA